MNTSLRSESGPWYKERWPWLLMLGPFLVIVAGLVTAWLAVRTADGLVDDDYYKQGMAVNQRIHRDQEAVQRGIESEVSVSPNGKQVTAVLREKSISTPPAVLLLTLSHPTTSGRDIELAMSIGPDGRYAAPLAQPLKGRWLVSMADPSKRWRLVGEWMPETALTLSLGPKKEIVNSSVSRKGD